jgi:hypothetical protein
VCLQTNAGDVANPTRGGCDIVAVIAGYAGGPSYPFFHTYSDHIADKDNSPQGWVIGGTYWVRINSTVDASSPDTGEIISAKAWAGDGSAPEPAGWQVSWKDPIAVTRNGAAAIRAGWYPGAQMDFDVDYFLVTSAGLPTVTPQLPSALIPRIELGAAVNGSNVILSWPAAAPVSYNLQSSSSPAGPYGPAGGSIVVVGDKNTVTLPISGHTYFRLMQ